MLRDAKDRRWCSFNNEWSLRWATEKNPGVRFLVVPEEATTLVTKDTIH